jgi:GDPmannose 4,6-dehydratase
MTKRAIIVGSGGQDGCLLFDLLLRRGYDVIGIEKTFVRSSHSLDFHSVDVLNGEEVTALLSSIQPNEVYYLAAFHHSSEDPVLHLTPRQMLQASMDTHVHGLINFLEAILQSSRRSRLFYAASCRIFGNPSQAPQDEQTPFNPVCAYGISKAAGVQCCRYYRQAHDVFAATGILYNHESHLRREPFVSQKIIRGARRIQQKKQDHLVLGNLSIIRDWGYAPDYVDAMQRLLQLEKPEDVIIATGEGHSVREFVQTAFSLLGLEWGNYVMEDPHLLQGPQPVYIGNPQHLARLTGWRPSLSFQEMISQLMLSNAQEMDL